jgi:transposase
MNYIFRSQKTLARFRYHIDVDGHYYSVPYKLVKEQVEVRITQSIVEILFKNKRIAVHARSTHRGSHTTLPEHMPKSHQKYLEWTPSRIVHWAGQNGPQTQALVTCILENRNHPEQGFRSCLGIMRLAKKFSPERLEAACARALIIKAYSYKSVESILKSKLDTQDLPAPATLEKPILHENLRGKDYYLTGEVFHA